MNRKVSYTGDAISMYTHTGTHIDALNHFGLHGRFWNGYTADEHLSNRGWNKFIGLPLKLRGASGSPLRPMAIPL